MKLIILFLFLSVSVFCQKPNVSVDNQGNFHPLTTEQQSENTGKFFISDSGEKFPVYKTEKGKLFIWRVSKKTGKKYRFYIRT